jgi:tRNA-dihydrouridine synthase
MSFMLSINQKVAENILQTAQFIDSQMPDFMGIELNIGCPSPKVMSCG